MRHITTYEAKDELTDVCLIPVKNILAVGNETGIVYFVDVKSSKILEVLPAHDERINTVEIFDEGKYMLTSSDSKEIKIWQLMDTFYSKTLPEGRDLLTRAI
jgi:WD40 repeat protein